MGEALATAGDGRPTHEPIDRDGPEQTETSQPTPDERLNPLLHRLRVNIDDHDLVEGSTAERTFHVNLHGSWGKAEKRFGNVGTLNPPS